MAYAGGKYTIDNYRKEIGWNSLPCNYKKACIWNNKMARLLQGKPPQPTAVLFNFLPKGEVQ